MVFQPVSSLSLQDLGLKPIYKSTIEHRADIDTSIDFLGLKLSLPLISAPMRTVTGEKLTNTLAQLGGLAVLPRNFNIASNNFLFTDKIVVSIPATGDYMDIVGEAFAIGFRRFCIDTANGYSEIVDKVIEKLRLFEEKVGEKIWIIAGNVGSWEGYYHLAQLGVDAVRCGISSGSMCETFKQTSVGIAQASLIRELAEKRKENYNKLGFWPAIISDGGITRPGDLAMVLALGADLAMGGNCFAGTEEAPGNVIKYNGELYKHFSGEAAHFVKGNNSYVEGADTLVRYKGSVEKVWKLYREGLQSSMSYMNCKNIEEFKYLDDECFVLLQGNARAEKDVYAK